MKQCIFFFFIISGLIISLNITAQEPAGQPPQVTLPSEQTAQGFAQLPSEVVRPDTRRAPDGELGNANKETWLPIGQIDIWMLLSITGLYVCFFSFKQLNYKKKI